MRRAKELGFGLLLVGISWLFFTALPVAGAARTHLLAAIRRAATARTLSASGRTYTVTATAYEAVVGQTDSKPFLTADNSRIPRSYGSHTRWLALSRDLLRPWGGPFEFGDKVRVQGISPALDGVYTVHDTMNRRYRHCLDVLVHPREHVTISRSGVKLRRISSSKPLSSTSLLLTSLRTSSKRKVARQRVRPHKEIAQRPTRRPRRASLVAARPRAKHGTLARHQQNIAKKQRLTALPKHSRKRIDA
jgi:3D (Asp-Asp-Asp) domain-containing protein